MFAYGDQNAIRKEDWKATCKANTNYLFYKFKFCTLYSLQRHANNDHVNTMGSYNTIQVDTFKWTGLSQQGVAN